jgi:hypothetical protein
VFNTTGVLLAAAPLSGPGGAPLSAYDVDVGDRQFSNPTGVASDGRGNVYVVDAANHPLPQNGPYRNTPWDLDFDERGNLYVLDRETQGSGYVNVLSPVAASVRSPSLRHRAGRVAVSVGCTAGSTCRGTLRVRKGTTVLASTSYRIGAGKSATVRVKLTPTGRRVVRRSRTHRVTVEIRPSNGPTVARTMTLRR